MTSRKMINDALRLVRLYWGYSQSELAQRLEVSQSLISEVEKGQKGVSLELLERYSRVLNIKMSQLMIFAEEIDGEPEIRRGKMIFADKILRLLERLKPREPTEA